MKTIRVHDAGKNAKRGWAVEDVQEIKRWVANCTTDPLTVDDPRYVPLHALALEDGSRVNVRGEDWLGPIVSLR